MKTKFDDTIAHDIPKTKATSEPALPWKLSDEEISEIEATDEEYKTALTAASPLHVRAIFVVLLIVSIFVAIVNSVVNIAIDNSEMQMRISSKERQVAAIKGALAKASGEKIALNENAVKLERRVNDLTAQKELYTAVIETLTKKTDEPQTSSN